MHAKSIFIFISLFLLTGFCLVTADDLIHLKNGRVIGVKTFRYQDGWIIMELPGGGEIGTLESQVAEVEKSSIQFADYKPREAVEYKDASAGRRSGRGGADMFMGEEMSEMDREQRRREMRERYEKRRREGYDDGEAPKEGDRPEDQDGFLDNRSPFDQNTRQQREDQIRRMEQEMKNKSK